MLSISTTNSRSVRLRLNPNVSAWEGPESGKEHLRFYLHSKKNHLLKDSYKETIVRNPKKVGYLGLR